MALAGKSVEEQPPWLLEAWILLVSPMILVKGIVRGPFPFPIIFYSQCMFAIHCIPNHWIQFPLSIHSYTHSCPYIALYLGKQRHGKETPHGGWESMVLLAFPTFLAKCRFVSAPFFCPRVGSQGFACFPNGFCSDPLVKLHFPIPSLLVIIDFCLFSQWFQPNVSLCPPIFACISNVFGQIPIYTSTNRTM